VIGLVSCGAQKLSHPAQARHLYTSTMFQMSRAWAERHCSQVYVLSAFHGLVELDTLLKPYDRRLGGKKETAAWASRTARAIADRHDRDIEISILAGADYARPLTAALRCLDGHHHDGWRGWRGAITEPLAGLGMGKRLAWLSAQNRSAA